jgi:hypothetical protein
MIFQYKIFTTICLKMPVEDINVEGFDNGWNVEGFDNGWKLEEFFTTDGI